MNCSVSQFISVYVSLKIKKPKDKIKHTLELGKVYSKPRNNVSKDI